MRERPLPQLTIQQLDYLVAVDGHDTWAEAAAALGVTPSALSQGLAELERRLGMRLFERDGRRRVIAESRRPIVDYARNVLGRTGDLSRWIETMQRGDAGSVRIGMIDAAAIHHYSDVIREFRLDHPGVEITLSVAPSGELLRQLADDRLDIVVAVEPRDHPPFIEWTELLVEPLAVYAPPGTSAQRPPSTWGPWVAFPASSHTRELIEQSLSEIGASFEVVAESNQPDVLREMVRLSIGWTVLPVVQAEAGPDPLVRARRTPLLERTLVAAWREGAMPSPLVRGLTERLEASSGTGSCV